MCKRNTIWWKCDRHPNRDGLSVIPEIAELSKRPARDTKRQYNARAAVGLRGQVRGFSSARNESQNPFNCLDLTRIQNWRRRCVRKGTRRWGCAASRRWYDRSAWHVEVKNSVRTVNCFWRERNVAQF